MSPLAVALILLSAVMHATWNVLARRTDEPYAFFFTLNLLSLVVWLPVVAFAGWNETITAGNIVLMTVSGALQVLYFALLAAAYQRGGVTVVYPVARGTGVALVPTAGFLIFAERPTLVGWAGVSATFVGIVLLGASGWMAHKQVNDPGARSAVAFAFMTGLVITTYSLFDNYGVEQVNPVVYGYGLIVATVAIQVPFILARRRSAIRRQLEFNWSAALAGAVLVLGTYMLVLLALAKSNVGYVVPLRETSIVFALILGVFVLREKVTAHRLAAAACIASGAVCIAIGG